MTAQILHDTWLILTVIATLEVSAISIYLFWTFRQSTRRKFFWMVAMAFASIAVEYVTAEIKNLSQPPPTDVAVAWLWVSGRVQECIALAIVLGYMVFGRNGSSAPTVNTTPEE